MKSVQGQKPDKALRKAVAEKRRSGQGPKGAQGIVIAASLAATVLGWAFFVSEDAQPVSPTDQQVPTAVAATQQSTAQVVASTSSATPQNTASSLAPTVQPSPTASTASSLTSYTNTTNSTASTSAPQAITRTRSSQ